MEIYKVIVIALATAFLCIYLKSFNSEYYFITLICGGIIILTLAISYLSKAFDFLNALTQKTGIDESLFSLIIKVTLISYLVEFTSGLIEDFGMKSLSDKVVFCGKIILICMSAPIFNALLNVITSFLN